MLRRAASEAPRDPEVHALLGRVALGAGRPGEAETALARAVELDPRNAELRVARGLALKRLGRYDDAESALLRALLLRPSDSVTLVSLAEVYRLSEQPEKCAARYGQFAEQVTRGQDPRSLGELERNALKRARQRDDYCKRLVP